VGTRYGSGAGIGRDLAGRAPDDGRLVEDVGASLLDPADDRDEAVHRTAEVDEVSVRAPAHRSGHLNRDYGDEALQGHEGLLGLDSVNRVDVPLDPRVR